MTELRDVTCHMGSHSVTCYPTQVNVPRPNPQPAGAYSITYPGGMEDWVDLGYTAMRRPEVELATSRLQVRRPNHHTTDPHVGLFSTSQWASHLPLYRETSSPLNCWSRTSSIIPSSIGRHYDECMVVPLDCTTLMSGYELLRFTVQPPFSRSQRVVRATSGAVKRAGRIDGVDFCRPMANGGDCWQTTGRNWSAAWRRFGFV